MVRFISRYLKYSDWLQTKDNVYIKSNAHPVQSAMSFFYPVRADHWNLFTQIERWQVGKENIFLAVKFTELFFLPLIFCNCLTLVKVMVDPKSILGTQKCEAGIQQSVTCRHSHTLTTLEHPIMFLGNRKKPGEPRGNLQGENMGPSLNYIQINIIINNSTIF